MRIIGIDPGSRITGYGIIDKLGPNLGFVACGTIRAEREKDFTRRLLVIFDGLSEVIERHRPEAAAVEDVFVAHNARSALKLGQARGAAVVALLRQGLPVHGYPPRLVKQAVTGCGGAEKAQVQHMIQVLLELSGPPSSDAADALAVAVCHAQRLAFG
ncbi:crossover junction endodeoxyribonuclease RuvC [Candidatus Electronema sp. JC]|uniref:crossover junction endodeoxyribonuclease RuvC n=1 Tax=Candidatus Electronema sp. JC TaxID=3401570 RepID=UPI003AA97925